MREFQIGFVPLRVRHFLQGRIIYPIRDCYDELIAVSTRHLFKEKSKSFWHEEFEKGFHFFGIHIAKKAMIKYQKAVVVEGELDVLAMHSNGISMTVGICGGAFGIFQLALLARYCPEVFILLDPDASGKRNTEKTLEKIKDLVNNQNQKGLRLIPCKLPGGYDPDDYVREFGKEGIVDLMKAEKKREIGIQV